MPHCAAAAAGGPPPPPPNRPADPAPLPTAGSCGPCVSQYSTADIPAEPRASKFARAVSFSFGGRRRDLHDPPPASPGPAAFSPQLPRPASPAPAFHGVEDTAPLRRAVKSPSPASYSPERADSFTRPRSPGAGAGGMHGRLPFAYLPRVEVAPTPTTYRPHKPGEGLLQRGTSFSHGPGHRGVPPSSLATGAATDGADTRVRRSASPSPASYSPVDLGQLRAASWSFGQRLVHRAPTERMPGPGAYDLE